MNKVDYNKNAKIYSLRVHIEKENDLYKYIEAQGNMQEYIKNLIRDDMISKYKGAIKNDK